MYRDKIVNKPWGHEYLVYENDEVGLWFLKIKRGNKHQCIVIQKKQQD